MARNGIRIVAFAVTLATGASLAAAADVSKKWRVSLAGGGFNPVDEVGSNAANSLSLLNIDLSPAALFEDPRNDSATFGNLDVQSGTLVTAAVQYAFNKLLLFEASLGYGESEIGDVSMDVQFVGNGPPNDQVAFVFDNFRVPVGDLERIPLQFTAIARFRQRAAFNPFFGAGIGYIFHGYTASDELNTLSLNMDSVQGTRYRVTESLAADAGLVEAGDPTDLSGATVDVRDTFEWHLVTGAEYSFKRRWAVFGEVRWTDASRKLSVGFNGSNELGISVPQFEDLVDSEIAQEFLAGLGAGPLLIGDNKNPIGLIDGGQFLYVRRDFADPSTVCDDPGNQDTLCEFDWIPKSEFETDTRLNEDFEPDGGLDPGFYYVQGGTVSYDGFTAQIGVRFTF